MWQINFISSCQRRNLVKTDELSVKLAQTVWNTVRRVQRLESVSCFCLQEQTCWNLTEAFNASVTCSFHSECCVFRNKTLKHLLFFCPSCSFLRLLAFPVSFPLLSFISSYFFPFVSFAFLSFSLLSSRSVALAEAEQLGMSHSSVAPPPPLTYINKLPVWQRHGGVLKSERNRASQLPTLELPSTLPPPPSISLSVCLSVSVTSGYSVKVTLLLSSARSLLLHQSDSHRSDDLRDEREERGLHLCCPLPLLLTSIPFDFFFFFFPSSRPSWCSRGGSETAPVISWFESLSARLRKSDQLGTRLCGLWSRSCRVIISRSDIRPAQLHRACMWRPPGSADGVGCCLVTWYADESAGAFIVPERWFIFRRSAFIVFFSRMGWVLHHQNSALYSHFTRTEVCGN